MIPRAEGLVSVRCSACHAPYDYHLRLHTPEASGFYRPRPRGRLACQHDAPAEGKRLIGHDNAGHALYTWSPVPPGA